MKIIVNTEKIQIKKEAQMIANEAQELASLGNHYFTIRFNSRLNKYNLWDELNEITEGTLQIQERGMGDDYFKLMVVENYD